MDAETFPVTRSDAEWRKLTETSTRRLVDGRVTPHYDPSIVMQFTEHADDYLIWQHYGRGDVLAAVLEANPALAQLPPVLTAGLVIELPELPLPAEAPVIRLWS